MRSRTYLCDPQAGSGDGSEQVSLFCLRKLIVLLSKTAAHSGGYVRAAATLPASACRASPSSASMPLSLRSRLAMRASRRRAWRSPPPRSRDWPEPVSPESAGELVLSHPRTQHPGALPEQCPHLADLRTSRSVTDTTDYRPAHTGQASQRSARRRDRTRNASSSCPSRPASAIRAASRNLGQ